MSNANGMKWWLTLAAIPALGMIFGADMGGLPAPRRRHPRLP